VHLLQLFLGPGDDAGPRLWSVPVRRRAAGGEGAEVATHQVRRRRVLEVSGRRDHDVSGVVDLLEEGCEIAAPEAPHALLRPQDGAAEGMIRPEGLGEQLHHEVIGRVLHHVDLFEDDLLLLGHLLRIEQGVGDDVAQDVDGQGQVVGSVGGTWTADSPTTIGL
jgi:hypothetical protein